MADRVATHVILDSQDQYIVHLVNHSDGTGEADVTKVDKSAIGVASDGAEPNALELEEVTSIISGFTNVLIETDHTADDLILALGPGSFYNDFTYSGSVRGQFKSTGGLLDPRGAGGTGDIFFTTTGAVAGAVYDITLKFRKNTV